MIESYVSGFYFHVYLACLHCYALDIQSPTVKKASVSVLSLHRPKL